MDTLNLCSDGDINNYVSSLYVKSIVLQMHDLWKLLGKQRLKTHLSCVHGKGEKYHKPIIILNAITNRVLLSFL